MAVRCSASERKTSSSFVILKTELGRAKLADGGGARTQHFVTLACTGGRSNTHKQSASDKPRTTSPPSVLEVLPVFKSAQRPQSVDKSSGWMGVAAGQPHADESLGIMASLCPEFLVGQDLLLLSLGH